MQCFDAAKIILDQMQISELFSSIVTRNSLHERYLQIKNLWNHCPFQQMKF